MADPGAPALRDAPANDVEPLVKEIEGHPENGATALHMETLSEVTTDAAELLRHRLDALRTAGRRTIYLHVVPGDVADVLGSAEFFKREGPNELIYMTAQAGEE